MMVVERSPAATIVERKEIKKMLPSRKRIYALASI